MTFDDKRYLLISIARKYASYKYEIDELVNEAWLDGNVSKQEDLKYFCLAARWAMLNYMRKQEKRNWKKYHIYTHPLIVGDSLTVEPEIVPDNYMDLLDDFEWLFGKLTQKQRKIVKLRMEGFDLKAIGMIIGCTGENIRQILLKVYNIIREHDRKICA